VPTERGIKAEKREKKKIFQRGKKPGKFASTAAEKGVKIQREVLPVLPRKRCAEGGRQSPPKKKRENKKEEATNSEEGKIEARLRGEGMK